jgi:uncharacterized protein (TIGR02270 family)
LVTQLIVRAVVLQHADDAAVLHSIRTTLTTAAHVRLRHIRRFDDRVAAHLDGLSVAGEAAWPIVDAALANPSPGALFTAAVGALECRSSERLNRLYALAEALPEIRRGLVAAFGWVEQRQLRGIVTGLLASPNPFLRWVGVSACAVHRVDPGAARDAALEGPASALRARALRAAGELGRRDLVPTCLSMLQADDPASRFWAPWSAVVLGDRSEAALAALKIMGETPGPYRSRAFRLALQTLEVSECHEWLRDIARDPENKRWLIQGSGVAGDPMYVPWLIKQMADDKSARIAGEAFSTITGLDLAYLELDRRVPEGGGEGPNDDPNDPRVDMDADHGLPYPNQERIARWWGANGGRFVNGRRYFLGAPLSREHCVRGLKEGFQRQRILAAHHLCLLEPGTTLFEWRAPAARQQRILTGLG